MMRDGEKGKNLKDMGEREKKGSGRRECSEGIDGTYPHKKREGAKEEK